MNGVTVWLNETGYRTRGGARLGIGQLHKIPTKARGHSLQSHLGGGEMDEGSEALIGFVVACGDAAVLFEVAEEFFDKVTPSIHGENASDRCFTV